MLKNESLFVNFWTKVALSNSQCTVLYAGILCTK